MGAGGAEVSIDRGSKGRSVGERQGDEMIIPINMVEAQG